MSGTGWLRGALLLVVAVSACTRMNPAFRGPQEDAGGAPPDGAIGDGGATPDGGQVAGDGGAGACTAGAKGCLGNVLLKCEADGTWTPMRECPSLCLEVGGEPHCGGFYPSNELPKCGELDTTLLPFVAEVWSQPTIIDTDQRSITGPSGETTWVAVEERDQGPDAPKLALFKFESFNVPAGATVLAVGSRALAIWAQREVIVAGRLRAGGNASAATLEIRSPAGAWGVNSTWSAGTGGAGVLGGGAGGGGYGASGGAGGQGGADPAQAGAGGAGYGTADLIPLRGGSPGGVAPTDGRALSDGGGAIQIVACREFDLREGGAVSASGQGAQGGTVVVAPETAVTGGGGGGSGGAILIESPRLVVAAVVAANGGGGGGGAAIAAGSVHGGRGEDGLESEAAAAGGTAGGSNAGVGGAGGAKAVLTGGGGGSATAPAFSGGGGGGGVGRIRLNSVALERVDLGITDQGGVASPPPTTGKRPVW